MTQSLVHTEPRVLPGGLDPIGPLGFGTWRFTTDDLAAAQELVETALELGMNLIDTADVYGLDYGGTGFGGNEEVCSARCWRSRPACATGWCSRPRAASCRRSRTTPATPTCAPAVDASLQRLGCRRDRSLPDPPSRHVRPSRAGGGHARRRWWPRARSGPIGDLEPHAPPSTMPSLAHLGDLPLATSQPEYSPAFLGPLRDGTFDRCMRDGVVPLAWSPLGGGRLMSGDGRPPRVNRHPRRARRA